MSEGTALIDAIWNKASSDSSLMGKVVQTGTIKKGIFYDRVPEHATMPYIVYKIPDKTLVQDFCSYYISSMVYFNIYDTSESITTICSIKDRLTTVFDRAVLTYTGKDSIMCLRLTDIDPQKTEDGWVSTVIYNIAYRASS